NGFIAFGVPVVLTLMSLGSSAFSWFYDYGWFTGSLLGAAIYYGLCRLSSPQTAVAKSTL
ncbi:MAG: nitrate reductase, partial [Pseudomonas helleri]